MNDWTVKSTEKNYILAIKYPWLPEMVIVTFDGIQMFVAKDPKDEFREGVQLPSETAKVYWAAIQRESITGTAKHMTFEEMTPYQKTVFMTEASDTHTRYCDKIKKLWERVPVSKIIDYADNNNFCVDYYPGISEMGYDDTPAIAANWNPPKMKRLGDWIEKFYHGNVSIEWSDEWTSCSDCGKAVRTSPDSYGWEPSYVWVSDCEIICRDCIHDCMDEVVERYKNRTDSALPSWIQEQVEKLGFTCLADEETYCTRFETGWYRGQNDTPEKAIKLAKEILPYKFDYMFLITDRGQFDVHWTILIRKVEEEETID